MEWKSKTWWCEKCHHYISGQYKDCPFCKTLAKEAKETDWLLSKWRKERRLIAIGNLNKRGLDTSYRNKSNQGVDKNRRKRT